MSNKELYETFHKGTTFLKNVPNRSDFSLRNHLGIYDKYIHEGLTVLDIGCGCGAFSLYAAGKGALVKGVDLSEKAIAEDNKSATFLKLGNLSFVCEDFMQYSDLEAYDVILMTEVLEHLPDDSAALKKVHGLLKRDGHLLMSVPSSNAPLHKKYVKEYGKDPFDERVGHLRRYDGVGIFNLLANAGFELVEFRFCEGYLRNWLFNDNLGQRFMRLNRGFLQDLVSYVDDFIFTPVWGESDIILVAKRR